jgi:arylsulfatase A-like enzyme
MVIVGPGIPAGRSTEAFAYVHDLFPTITELAGVSPPAGVDGLSLGPVWQGRVTHTRDSLFTAYMETQRAVRDQRWKLIAYPAIGYLQLFDLRADPFETTNLVDQPARAAELARLQGLMRDWQSRQGDTVAVPSTSTRPAPIDLTGLPRKTDQWQPDWIVQKYFGH